MADEKRPHSAGPRAAEPKRPVISAASSSDTHEVEHGSIRWRGIFAGGFVALLAYFILMSFGLAVGGGTIESAIRGETTLEGFGAGAGIWTVFSILVSLFAGGYIAARSSGYVPIRVGRIEGAVVAALFFAFVLFQTGTAVGMLGRGVGAAMGTVGGAIGNLAGTPQVQGVVDEMIGDLELRSDPDTVIQGVAMRLIRGDDQAAIRYLSRQTGITEAEARERIQTVSQDVQQAAADAGATLATALQIIGWTLFGSLLLGSIAAILGGGLGASTTLRFPLDRADRKAMEGKRAA